MPDALLETERGLSAEQVAERVAQGRGNDVASRTSRGVWEIVRANVFTRINAIFAVLFAIIASTGYLLDGLFGFLIVANSVVGVIQELRAKRTLDRLSIIGQARPRVRRDGAAKELAPREVVADDVIELGPGDQAVVDGEILSADSLEVDESLLTGESEPVVKQAGDRMLSGSFVVAGGGLYRATAVGREAYAAQLAAQASKFTLVNSELRNGINRILKVITFLLVPAGALAIYNQLQTNDPLQEALRGMVAALVPMVPEGLILITSIAFAMGVIRLGRRQCLVNELPAIEGLARVDVVCADKTGTLTENAMRLSSVKTLDDSDVDSVLAALAAADPHPNASLKAVAEAYGDNPGWKVEDVAAFSSARKWSGASFGGGNGTWLLGAPDVMLRQGDKALAEAESLAGQGLRVLLLASAPGLATEGCHARALIVLDQRVRPDAKETLEYFAEQGVSVKIMSGDNPASVGAVAASLDLPLAGKPIDARDLPQDKAELAKTLDETSVFGRVTPEQKRTMVKALQANGHTVAMTGDGVNDVLALKDADIGVAMGSGSPATRAVGDIVLLDNKFATLPFVVAEGRRVIGNIERVSILFLTKTIYSVMLALMVGIPGLIGLDVIPYPFLPRHVTVMGWFTIGLPAFVLSLAPNSERAKPDFVPRVMRLAIPAGVSIGLACFTSYLVTRDTTTAFITTVTIALWVLAVIARPYLWWKALLVAVMAVLSALMLVWPPTQKLLELDPGDAGHTAIGFACAAGGIALTHLLWKLVKR